MIQHKKIHKCAKFHAFNTKCTILCLNSSTSAFLTKNYLSMSILDKRNFHSSQSGNLVPAHEKQIAHNWYLPPASAQRHVVMLSPYKNNINGHAWYKDFFHISQSETVWKIPCNQHGFYMEFSLVNHCHHWIRFWHESKLVSLRWSGSLTHEYIAGPSSKCLHSEIITTTLLSESPCTNRETSIGCLYCIMSLPCIAFIWIISLLTGLNMFWFHRSRN